MDPVIELHGIHFAYGKTPVLTGLDLTVNRGEVVAMLGPNGAGKTTLVENVMGSFAPQRGKVRVFGTDPTKASAKFWSKVGLVQQHWTDHPKWSVAHQLEWIKATYDSVNKPTKTVDQVLEDVGLTEKKNARLGKISGGQRRRIDFACATIGRPSLLIMDEPTTGLDPKAKAEIHDLISQTVDEGTTVLMTTHDLSEAEKIASRVVILNSGKIIASGSARELREQLVGQAEITWSEDAENHVHSTDAVESFVATLDLTKITNLTITRPTLEDAYLTLVADEIAQEVSQ
ncbi:MAG: ABC transporter ATP-binding protein [Actinomycetaceae bacterium]|nr:ABC transporter ATP-binding protein [Actinomycetaceae bacterium]